MLMGMLFNRCEVLQGLLVLGVRLGRPHRAHVARQRGRLLLCGPCLDGSPLAFIDVGSVPFNTWVHDRSDGISC